MVFYLVLNGDVRLMKRLLVLGSQLKLADFSPTLEEPSMKVLDRRLVVFDARDRHGYTSPQSEWRTGRDLRDGCTGAEIVKVFLVDFEVFGWKGMEKGEVGGQMVAMLGKVFGAQVCERLFGD